MSLTIVFMLVGTIVFLMKVMNIYWEQLKMWESKYDRENNKRRI